MLKLYDVLNRQLLFVFKLVRPLTSFVLLVKVDFFVLFVLVVVCVLTLCKSTAYYMFLEHKTFGETDAVLCMQIYVGAGYYLTLFLPSQILPLQVDCKLLHHRVIGLVVFNLCDPQAFFFNLPLRVRGCQAVVCGYAE